jgi:hypothetical protein
LKKGKGVAETWGLGKKDDLFRPIWLIIKDEGEMAIGHKKKALIHIAKDNLHLDETSYRQILKGVAGVGSAKELTSEGFEKVMRRFQEMGFKGLLPSPYHPVPRGRLIPSGSPQGFEPITSNQQDFISYLLERLSWSEEHYHAFCQRIIKKPDPLTKREGQKIIIGLMAIWRSKSKLPAEGRERNGERSQL